MFPYHSVIPFFSSFTVVRPTQIFALSKKDLFEKRNNKPVVFSNQQKFVLRDFSRTSFSRCCRKVRDARRWYHRSFGNKPSSAKLILCSCLVVSRLYSLMLDYKASYSETSCDQKKFFFNATDRPTQEMHSTVIDKTKGDGLII